jgi:hypothetical protein
VTSVRKFINDKNWYLRLNRARHLEPHARFVRPACIHSRHMDIPQGTAVDDPQLALYVCSSFHIPTGRKWILISTTQVPYVSVLQQNHTLYTDPSAPLGHIPQPNPTPKGCSRPTPARPITPSPRPNLESKPRSPTDMDIPG